MSVTDSTIRPTQLKVIGAGLGRSGTLTLAAALEKLGFGPCHHPLSIPVEQNPWKLFTKAAKGTASIEEIDEAYRGYSSAVDNPAAIAIPSLLKAYPDAKFILTTRDASQWAQSLRKTVIDVLWAGYNDRKNKIALGTATEAEKQLNEAWHHIWAAQWLEHLFDEYHQGRLEIDPEGEFKRHNDYIKTLVPTDRLLVFDVTEGWEPLATFLNVTVPNEEFPHINNAAQFQDERSEWKAR